MPVYKKSPIPSIRNSPTTACGIKQDDNVDWDHANAICQKKESTLPRFIDQFEFNEFYGTQVP
jgi:hypothetical protein